MPVIPVPLPLALDVVAAAVLVVVSVSCKGTQIHLYAVVAAPAELVVKEGDLNQLRQRAVQVFYIAPVIRELRGR
jgi:hypothetical protein